MSKVKVTSASNNMSYYYNNITAGAVCVSTFTTLLTEMSFEKSPKQAVSHPVQKYPVRRLEPSISKFLKVLEIDLDRLHRHRLNIEKVKST